MANKSKSGCGRAAGGCLVLVVIVGAIGFLLVRELDFTAFTDPPEPVAVASDSVQAERLELIESYIEAGILQKIATPGSAPRAYVLPGFYALSFDDKEACAGVWYAWAFEVPPGDPPRSGDYLFIYDGLTDKKVGNFGELGLDLD